MTVKEVQLSGQPEDCNLSGPDECIDYLMIHNQTSINSLKNQKKQCLVNVFSFIRTSFWGH